MQQHRQRCFCSKQDLLNIRIALCISCFQRLFKTWANLEVLTRTSRFDIHQTSQVAQAIAHFKRSPKRNVVAHLDKPSNNSETATSFVSCQTISLVPSRPVFTSRKKQALLIVHTRREVLARFGYRKKKRCFLRLERVRLGKITYIYYNLKGPYVISYVSIHKREGEISNAPRIDGLFFSFTGLGI